MKFLNVFLTVLLFVSTALAQRTGGSFGGSSWGSGSSRSSTTTTTPFTRAAPSPTYRSTVSIPRSTPYINRAVSTPRNPSTYGTRDTSPTASTPSGGIVVVNNDDSPIESEPIDLTDPVARDVASWIFGTLAFVVIVGVMFGKWRSITRRSSWHDW